MGGRRQGERTSLEDRRHVRKMHTRELAKPQQNGGPPLLRSPDGQSERRSRNSSRLPSGCSFVLDCTNDRREYGAARASGDHLRDDAANTQIARLRCSHDRRQQ